MRNTSRFILRTVAIATFAGLTIGGSVRFSSADGIGGGGAENLDAIESTQYLTGAGAGGAPVTGYSTGTGSTGYGTGTGGPTESGTGAGGTTGTSTNHNDSGGRAPCPDNSNNVGPSGRDY